jgi:phospholipid/cholesterol/gamma-HCH transport system permease protein
VARAVEICRARDVETDTSGLPPGLRRLVDLALAVPARGGPRPAKGRILERIGAAAIAYADGAKDVLGFVGEVAIAFVRLVAGKARVRPSDFFLLLEECGSQALGIVSLISFLVGAIFAFVGAVQLQRFGAQIFVADLVGIAVVREVGALMAGIILAGRTGAAFAAQLGTMRVTQETDALSTLGLSPMEFLVLPRVLALSLMMPLLCIYADLVGILGGASVGVGLLGVTPSTYLLRTLEAVKLSDFFGGLTKSLVYGVLVASAGCLRGLQCGRSAADVGGAATSAVVTGIVAIVTACGAFAVAFFVLGI